MLCDDDDAMVKIWGGCCIVWGVFFEYKLENAIN